MTDQIALDWFSSIFQICISMDVFAVTVCSVYTTKIRKVPEQLFVAQVL